MKLILDNGEEFELRPTKYPSVVVFEEDKALPLIKNFINCLYNENERISLDIPIECKPRQYVFRSLVINGGYYFPVLK